MLKIATIRACLQGDRVVVVIISEHIEKRLVRSCPKLRPHEKSGRIIRSRKLMMRSGYKGSRHRGEARKLGPGMERRCIGLGGS